MQVLEVCKKNDPYLKEHYNNDPMLMVKANDGILWDSARIRHAFNFGNGTDKDFLRFVRDNKCFCAFYDLDKCCFL